MSSLPPQKVSEVCWGTKRCKPFVPTDWDEQSNPSSRSRSAHLPSVKDEVTIRLIPQAFTQPGGIDMSGLSRRTLVIAHILLHQKPLPEWGVPPPGISSGSFKHPNSSASTCNLIRKAKCTGQDKISTHEIHDRLCHHRGTRTGMQALRSSMPR